MIFSKGFGLKTKNKPDVPDGSTIFRIGSVSKIFVVSSLPTDFLSFRTVRAFVGCLKQ